MNQYRSSQTTSCMRVGGWDWYVVDEIGKPLAEAANKTFGGSEMTEAAIYILEVRQNIKRAPANPNFERATRLSKSDRVSYTSNLDSCRKESERKLKPVWNLLGQATGAQPKPFAMDATNRFTIMWSKCMKLSGYDFRTPKDLGNELQRRIEGAGENLADLKQKVLPYDIAVTKSQIGCFKPILPQALADYARTYKKELHSMGEKEKEALDAMETLEHTPPS